MTLTPKTRQALKAKAHSLKPVILLGNQGLTESVLKEIDRALTDHELIKIRVPIENRDARRSTVVEICEKQNAQCVQMIGQIAIVYRKSTKN